MTNLEACFKKVTVWIERPNGLVRFSPTGKIIARIHRNTIGMAEYKVRAEGTASCWCMGWGDTIEQCKQSVDATLVSWRYNLAEPIPEKFVAMF